MTSAPDTEKTAILATYTTRRDAEMARDYLADVDIQAFVKTDDAGGMHPQLQRPHGVKLVGMSGTARRARSLLADAGLLPDESGAETDGPSREGPSETVANSMYGVVLVLGVVAVVLVLLMVLLG